VKIRFGTYVVVSLVWIACGAVIGYTWATPVPQASSYQDHLRAACDAWLATTSSMEPPSDEVLSIYSACLNFEEVTE
jgi:hypothetical protein